MDEQKKALVKGLVIGFAALLMVQCAAVGFLWVFRRLTKAEMTPASKIQEIVRLLDAHYVDTYDKALAIETMYAGLVYGVGDPYTVYLDEDTLTRFLEQTAGEYAGIGISVTIDRKDNRITVAAVFENSPGARAGIRAGDKIVGVEGQEVWGDGYEEAIEMIKGKPGTRVNLTIYRESTERTFNIDVTRENISIPTVSYKMLDNGIGYVRLSAFEGVTYRQFMTAYESLSAQGLTGLIIDVRNNPGGLLHIVTSIADELVPEGVIVYTETKDGTRNYINSGESHIGIPLAILVNGASASASEVLAGAVKDLGVGVLVGTQTFGKGVVQDLFRLPDGSAVKITVSKYYTPGGVCIQGEGITPDYAVEMEDSLRLDFGEFPAEDDPQLRKAVEVLEQQIAY